MPLPANSKKRLTCILCILLPFTTALAQKLPNKQEFPVLAPVAIKIDGKANEWNEQFQAYNGATEVFYSVANDKNNLYLIVRALKPLIIKKIINQGMVFTINSSMKKEANNSVAITYPLLHNVNVGVVTNNLKPASPITDSIITAMNSQFADQSKEIKITGSPTLTDSLVSVYNDMGIKAASLFNSEKAYTYELAIPLKTLGLSGDKFTYNLKINGVAAYGINARLSSDGHAIVMGNRVPGEVMVEIVYPPDVLATYFATDFWGEYTLAK